MASAEVHNWGDWQRLKPLEQLLIDNSAAFGSYVMAGVFGFTPDKPIDIHWVRTAIGERLLAHPRFRSVLKVSRFGKATFVEPAVPMDLNKHIHLESASEAHASLQERTAAYHSLLGSLLTAPLPLDQPLWSVHLLPGYAVDTPENRGNSVFLRVHHSIADGVGMVLFCAMHVADRTFGDLESLLPKPARQLGDQHSRSSRKFSKNLVLVGMQSFSRLPREGVSVFFGTAIPDSRNVFNVASGPVGPDCRIRFMHVIPPSLFPFAQVRQASKRLSVTINDLFVTAISGTIREYILRHGEQHAFPRRLRVGFSVNRHNMTAEDTAVSNLVAILPVRIPIRVAEREKRLRRIAEMTRRLKTGKKVQLATIAYSMLSKLPLLVRMPILSQYSHSISGFASNVPGPRAPIFLAGNQLATIAVSAPVDDRGAGVAFTFFTYNSNCSICISGDSKRILQHEDLVQIFIYEMIELCNLGL